MQMTNAHELLLNLLEDPSDFPKHLEMHSGSIIMSSVYSYEASRHDDPMIERISMALEVVIQELRPEIAAVFILRLPSWLPGIRLKRVAPLARKLTSEILEIPFAYTEGGLAAGSVSSCMVVDNLLNIDEDDSDSAWQKKALKESAATVYGGNALAIDVNAPWLTYKAWGSQYGKCTLIIPVASNSGTDSDAPESSGDVVYTRLFLQDNIIINSEQVARDLLEHRSQNYSDRPEIATNELFGIDYSTAFMPYGNRWRLQRKFMQQSFRQDVAPNFRTMQVAKAHELLLNLLEDPSDFPKHLEMHSGSVIMSSVYSYEASRRDDPMIERISMTLEVTIQELRPEVAAVFSAFPYLLRLPSWLPGMRLKRVAPLARKLGTEILEIPFAYTEGGLAAGSVSSCMVVDSLLNIDENDSNSAWQKKALKESAATMYAGEHI
ncbi:hypothetical protein AZE42_04066 [Rhizopogon vesiculosus]|uniref:Cytochrome P450 n=1 Tax=Rhizopogon vesiculosus TaxID=180088 RepID=A0A1J8QE08_9AGAM|nr:hypothetical protein AZE42_04066 [Rhizopogon vesiculosus]